MRRMVTKHCNGWQLVDTSAMRTLATLGWVLVAVLVVDALGFMGWVLSGQYPTDSFYLGTITAHALGLNW